MENEQNTNSTPKDNMVQTPSTEPEKFGPTIGIVIIVAVLVVGGFYFWSMSSMKTDADPAQTPATQAVSFEVLDSTSDTTNTITEDEFNALLEKAAESTGTESTTDALEAELGDFSDLDALEAEFDNLDF